MGNSAINPLALMLGATGMGQQLPAFLIEQIRRSQEATMPPEARPQEMGGTAVGPREPSELELLLLAQAGGGTPSMYGAPSQTQAASTGAQVAAALGPAGQAQALGRSSVLPTIAAMEQMRNARAAQSMAAQKARAGAPMAAAKLSREQAETEKVRAETMDIPKKRAQREREIELLGQLRILREKAAVQTEGRDAIRFMADYAKTVRELIKTDKELAALQMWGEDLPSFAGMIRQLPPGEPQKDAYDTLLRGPFEELGKKVLERHGLKPDKGRLGAYVDQQIESFTSMLSEGAADLIGAPKIQAAPEELPTPTGEETPGTKMNLFERMMGE